MIVAVEGGTTRTRAGLYTADGVMQAEAEGPPCNPAEFGVARCVRTIASLARGLTHEPGIMLAAGVSGAKALALREAVAHELRDDLDAARVVVTDDLHPILRASARNAAAVLAIAGTGSSVLVQTADGSSWILGGRGRLFGDDGSAYQIAVAALRAASQSVDGLAPPTALVEALSQSAGVAAFHDLVPWSMRATKDRVAALARAVDALASGGDAAAAACVADQAKRLAALVQAGIVRLGLPAPPPVYIHGGLFEQSTLFRDAFSGALVSATGCATPDFPPVRGHRAVLALAEGPVPEWASECIRGRVASAQRREIPTERALDAGPPLDALAPIDIVRTMHCEDARAVEAVALEETAVAAAIEAVACALRSGGRLIYLGAGTSGRLGVLDASECLPTFGVPSDRVIGIIAGGERALRESVEGAEDDEDLARADLERIVPPLDSRDVVIGIAASGRTPYTLSGLAWAASRGATTALVTCDPRCDASVDILIALDTSAEVLAGSTRLKAGTATKLVLNMISTGAMARAGYVFDGKMIGVRPINAKLRRRAVRIVATLGGLDETDAGRLLEQAGGAIPVAVLMARKRLDAEAARRRLREAGGMLRDALDPE